MALDHGADALELDVHCSADREVVVFHDFTVHGMSLAATPWSTLSQIDLGDGAHIPRLADVLKAVGAAATVYIELKGADIEDAVLTVAKQHGHRFALHSFDHAAIARASRLAPDVRRGILLDRGLRNVGATLQAAVAQTGASDVWPHWSLVDSELTGLAHALGARVITWTVNEGVLADSMLQAGVDGICTDDVRLLPA